MDSSKPTIDASKHDEGLVEVESPSFDESLFTELASAVRYGFKTQIERILSKNASFINHFDNEGYTLAHWACKKEDTSILEVLYQHGADLSARTKCEAQMLPIHWAASDGRISVLRFLIDHRQDINIPDANNCSPLIVATQHNQTAAIIFLIKNNADITHHDNNGDSALHWAAYKGLVEATALLAYQMPLEINRDDYFGQTPVHLSALQGHLDCLDYLVNECSGDISKRDKNGLTPLDLSMKKNMISTEWFLRRRSAKGVIDLLNGLGMQRLKSSRYWRYMLIGANDKENSQWAWRVVFASNFVGSIVMVVFALDEHLSDLYLLHQTNTALVMLWWLMFIMCLVKSPGSVADNLSDGGKHSYETALTTIAKIGQDSTAIVSEEEMPNICHTCRVLRPLRSKHCKLLKRCIYKFDHFCPFVGNTVGRDNYKFFYALLVVHAICGSLWLVTAVYLCRRTSVSWSLILFSIYSCMWMMMIGALLQYHTYLISMNMTTNENINVNKYSYLHDEGHEFRNPFNRGSFFANLLDVISPSMDVYYTKKALRYF